MKLFKSICIFLVLFHFSNTIQSQVVAKSKELTLYDIWASGAFAQKSINGLESMNDGNYFTSIEKYKFGQCIVRQSYKTGEVKDTLLKGEWFVKDLTSAPLIIDGYSFSADEKKILISSQSEQIYRHSSKAFNRVYDLKTKKITVVSNLGKQMYASFSADGNKVAFVRDNNIFITDLTNGTETQVTTDGERNKIINGANDWVYEEEFSFSICFFWSPNGDKIAYYKFDESKVKEYDMTEYGSLYPSQYKYKYPKAGEDNSIVSLHIYNVLDKKTIKIDVGSNPDQYIPRVKWTNNNNTLSFQRLNRLQNKLELLLADATTGVSKTIITEESNTYVEVVDFLTFLKDNKTFIWNSEKDGYQHLYLYDINGKELLQLTKGKWDVMKFYGVDEKTGTLFYQSSEPSPTQRDVYSIKTDGSKKTKLSSQLGTNDARFSNSFNYFINYYSNANTPLYITLNDSKGKELRVLEDNAILKRKLAEYTLSKKEFLQVPTPDSLQLNAWMIKPFNFNPNKPYPMLMITYGGPGINTVNDAWEGAGFMWHQLMAQKGYIIVSVDNRGTGARGADFKKCTYKQLGKLEIQDQAWAAIYLTHLPYAIKNRIGMWGWSYGGYMSSLAITKHPNTFKAAVAIAPVTNWRYYDNIYTERYLQKPQDNPVGYDDNSPINFVDDLAGKYLLIHGMSDDNVHFQNAVEMIDALEKKNKQFDLMIYPNKNHGIGGGNTRLNLYTKVTDFLIKNL